MTNLNRLYPLLGPEERFRLVARAIAREDGQEVERLIRSSPKHTALVNDSRFWRRGEALDRFLDEVLLALFVEQQALEGEAERTRILARSARIAFALSEIAYEAGCHSSATVDADLAAGPASFHTWLGEAIKVVDEEEERVELGTDAKLLRSGYGRGDQGAVDQSVPSDRATRLAAFWRALELWFTKEVGVEIGPLLRGRYASPEVPELVAWVTELVDQAEVDPEMVAGFVAALEEFWWTELTR